MALVLKTSVPRGTVGSNPTPSAKDNGPARAGPFSCYNLLGFVYGLVAWPGDIMPSFHGQG